MFVKSNPRIRKDRKMETKLHEIAKFIRRNKALTKALSFTLCLVLLFYVIPSTIYTKAAELFKEDSNLDEESSSNSANGADTSPESEAEVLFEDISLREESAKHFRLSDGTYVAAQYNYPVHFEDENGDWQDIDNALTDSGSEFSNSNARIKFAKKITGNSNLFTLHDGNTKITLSLIGAIKGTVGEVTNNSDAEEDTELQKMMNLEKLSSSVLYKDILDGVDLEYVAYSMNVKENIIVKEKANTYSYSFELKLNGLTPVLTESGDVQIITDSEETKYIIPAPVVFDSEGNYAPSNCSSYALKHENGGKYTLTVAVDASWMNDSSRSFPVTIDPTISEGGSSIIDVSITSGNPTLTTNNDSELIAMSGTTYTRLIHLKATSLPEIPSSAKIVNASIWLYQKYYAGAYIAAYEVRTDWDETLTWAKYTDPDNPQGAKLAKILDYEFLEYSKYYDWDVTKLVKKWYNGSNYGVAFGCIPIGNANTSATFYSNENIVTGEENRPFFTITYKDMKGIESYWPFVSHSAGIAGNGNINMANGQLVFTIPTLTATDNIFSYTPTLVYDASMADQSYAKPNADVAFSDSMAGVGFRLNICETIVAHKVDNEILYYVYSDADGTEHAIVEDEEGIFRDEDGLGFILTVNSAGNITLENTAHEVRYFQKKGETSTEAYWRLYSITDIHGNQLVFTFINSYQPSKVSLIPNGQTAPIDLLELTYNSGVLRSVYNPTTKVRAVLRYSDTYNGNILSSATKYLRQIDYAYGNESVTALNWDGFFLKPNVVLNITVYERAKYNYDSSGRLIEVENVNASTSIKYQYSGAYLSRVSEYGEGNLGNSFYVNVLGDSTYVQGDGADGNLGTADDIRTNYLIDNYGRCISVYSSSKDGYTVYGASVYSYDSNDNSVNSISQAATLDSEHPNYLLNGSFEAVSNNRPLHWSKTSNVISSDLTLLNGSFNKSVSFHPSLGSTARIDQDVVLDPGEYTLSMPIAFLNCNSVIGTVKIYDTTNSRTLHSEQITPILASGETFFSTTFKIPSNSAESSVKVIISFTSTDSELSSTIEIDSVMLSKTLGASKFNLVDNGSFENTYYDGSADAAMIAKSWATESGGTVRASESYGSIGKRVILQNTDGGDKYIKQNIYTASAATLSACDQNGASAIDNQMHTFSVSGFAYSASAVKGRSFGLKAEIVYYCGEGQPDITTEYYYGFNADNEAWQYTAGTFTLGYDQSGNSIGEYLCVKSIAIYCDCSDHYGVIASFNDVSVTYAGINPASKYTYTNDGKIETYTCGDDVFYYFYNANGNLYYTADNSGNLILYQYDSANQNIVKTITENKFTYNGTDDFPYELSNPLLAVERTAIKAVVYVYNDYGLIITEVLRTFNESGAIDGNTGFVFVSYEYNVDLQSKIFGALIYEEHKPLTITKYFYDENTGNLLASVNGYDYTGTAYSYDGAGRLIGVYPATYLPDENTYVSTTDSESVEYTYDAQNRLSTITSESTTYTLYYDSYGNQSEVKVGDNDLISYEYKSHNGNVSRIVYANGHEIRYVYNDIDLLCEIWYNEDEEAAYEYKYTADGRLCSIKNNVSDTVTLYSYNTDGSVTSCVEYKDGGTHISTDVRYDTESRVSGIEYTAYCGVGSALTGQTSLYEYEYDDSDRLSGESVSVGNTEIDTSYSYDRFDRLTYADHSFMTSGADGESFGYSESYAYLKYAAHTLFLPDEYTVDIRLGSTVDSVYYALAYDTNGNITKLYKYCNDSYVGYCEYVYDDIGQLVRENNSLLSRTFVYEYDTAGNIISKTTYRYTTAATITSNPLSVDSYLYEDADWGDLLTNYNGVEITYDAIGNPLSYYNGDNYTFSWDGRRLQSITKGGVTYSYTYNDEGIRTRKTVGGVTTYYLYSGSLLISEYTDTETIIYIYDANGSPLGFKYRLNTYAEDAWDTYWYEKNMQGDIVAIYSENGTKLISYLYDAWGNASISYTGGGASTTAVNNRLTYRGYYYDAETQLYWVSSRCYSPELCRWISPDSIEYLDPESINGLNLYVYCGNDPVNKYDPTGHFGILAIIGIVGAAILIGGGAQLASNALAGETGSDLWRGVAGSALGSGVNALALCLSPFTGGASLAFAAGLGAAVQTGVDTLETVIRGETVNGWQTVADLGINCITTFAGNWIGSKLIPTNSGWFEPKKFLSVFMKPYGQKILLQTAIGAGLSGIVNFARKFD